MTELIKYDAMCRAIDAAYTVDEVKDIRDKAKAMEAYAQQALNTEAERRACEIRLRAERRAGRMLSEMDKAKGGWPKADSVSSDTTPTLAEMGISRDQSSKWQQLAGVPEDQFEAALSGPDKPSTNGIIKPKAEPMNPGAILLWGHLRDLERHNLLQSGVNNLLADMTDGMVADVKRLAPIIAEWLGEIDED